MSRLNGWQRLWVLITVLWVLIVGAAGLTSNPNGYRSWRDAPIVDETKPFDPDAYLASKKLYIGERFLDFASAALLPPPCLYLLGLGLAWVRKGFRKP